LFTGEKVRWEEGSWRKTGML